MTDEPRQTIIGFFPGVFDLLHAGHVAALGWARERCSVLVAGLQVNPRVERPDKSAPIQSMYERYAQLRACRWVSEVVPYATEADLMNVMATYPMHVRFAGADWDADRVTGAAVCKQMGIEIIKVPRLHGYSTAELRRRVHTAEERLLGRGPTITEPMRDMPDVVCK